MKALPVLQPKQTQQHKKLDNLLLTVLITEQV